MTTEPTLREKVKKVLQGYYEGCDDLDVGVNDIADLLSATGAPAYIRVADDLRGVVREEEPVAAEYDFKAEDAWEDHPARYLGQFDKRGGE